MKLYFTKIDDISLDDVTRINKKRAEKSARYKRADDKKRCIAGGLFENKFLKNAVITTNEYGKPIADNGLFYNISHSGDYIIFAIDDTEIGCDVEKHRDMEYLKMGKIIFCENEMNALKYANNIKEEFFKLWTRKESILKCLGGGFHIESKSVDVSKDFAEYNNKIFYFKSWQIDDYTITLCSPKNEFPINITRCIL